MTDQPIDPADLPTRHENPTHPADLPTRHENPSSPGSTPRVNWFGHLPRGVVDRYEFIRPLSTEGGQADVLLFRDGTGGEEVVIKLYRGRPAINRDTYDTLQDIDAEHVTPILDLRVEEDGIWEVQEYLRHGSLHDLVQARGGGPQAPEFVRKVIEELTPALGAIHARDITHRDLKPGNIFVRQVEPLDLVLGDFGFARDIRMSAEYMSVVGVFHYTAPEAIAGEAGPANDWWSLGVIIYELLTGASLFLNADGRREPNQRVVQGHLHRSTYTIASVADPRWNLLLRGLLNRSRSHRWGEQQVSAWLAGDSPEVIEGDEASTTDPAFAIPPIVVPGGEFTDPAEAISAMADRWDDACTYLTGTGLGHLRHWLKQTPIGSSPIGSRADDILSRVRDTDRSTQTALVQLQVMLAPSRAVRFQGRTVDGPTLVAAAQGAVGGNTSDQSWIRDLRNFQVLGEIGSHATAGTLIVDADVRLRQFWNEAATLLQQARNHPETGSLVPGVEGRFEGSLLAAALDPARGLRHVESGRRVATRVQDSAGPLHDWASRARAGSVPAALLLETVGTLVLKDRDAREKQIREADRGAARGRRRAERRQRRAAVSRRLPARLGGSAIVTLIMAVSSLPFSTGPSWQEVAIQIGGPLVVAVLVAAVVEYLIPVRPSTPAFGFGLAALGWYAVATFPHSYDQATWWVGIDWIAPLPFAFLAGYVTGFVLGWALSRLPTRSGSSSVPTMLRVVPFGVLCLMGVELVQGAANAHSGSLRAGAWADSLASATGALVWPFVSTDFIGFLLPVAGLVALMTLVALPVLAGLPRGLRWIVWLAITVLGLAVLLPGLPFLISRFWITLLVAIAVGAAAFVASGRPA